MNRLPLSLVLVGAYLVAFQMYNQSPNQGQLNFISGEDISLNGQLWNSGRFNPMAPQGLKPNHYQAEDLTALKLIDNSIRLRDGHYQMGLLGRDDNPVLPYNRPLAEAGLQYLKKRFRRELNTEMLFRSA